MISKRGPYSKDRERFPLILAILKKHLHGIGLNELHRILRINKGTLIGDLNKLKISHEVEQDSVTEKYRVSSTSLYLAEFELTSKINEEIKKESSNESDSKKMIESLIKWTGILSIYCALKQIETNREWTIISSGYISKDNYLLAFLKRYITKPAIPEDVKPEDMGSEVIRNVLNLWSSDLTRETKTEDKAKNRIRELKTIFEEYYETEVKIIERSFSI